MASLVVVVVVNWNGKHHLKDCLDSLLSVDYPRYKVVVVDNGSEDGSVEFVRSHYPDVHLMRNEKNLGFAEGNNVGIQFALSRGADYVVLLNNDTRVEPGFLAHLIQRGEEDKGIGVLGGKVLMHVDPRIVNSTGVNLNQFAYGWDRDFGEEALQIHRDRGEVLAVTGCLMAVKREVFEEIGLLDPKFFAYYEDVDFCIRVWKYTSFRVEYVPESVIYHKFSASGPEASPLKKYLMMRNQYRIFFKHFPLAEMCKKAPLLLLHRSRTVMGHVKRKDFYLFFSEVVIMLKYLMLLPLIFLSRIPDSFKEGLDEHRFWGKVNAGRSAPSLKSFPSEYARVALTKREVSINGISNRILMGVNDEILGEGWSPLVPEFPRIRRMDPHAVCFLRNEKRFEYLQIHGMWNSNTREPWLEVALEGQVIGRSQVRTGWHTYVFRVENHFNEGLIEAHFRMISSDDFPESGKGFCINEIGLLPSGSPFLRGAE